MLLSNVYHKRSLDCYSFFDAKLFSRYEVLVVQQMYKLLAEKCKAHSKMVICVIKNNKPG